MSSGGLNDNGKLETHGWDFLQLPIEIVLDENLSDRDVRIYAYLLWRAGLSGKAWPGIRRIADDMKVSEKTVERAIDNLIGQDWIRRERRYGRSSITHIFASREKCLEFDSKQRKHAHVDKTTSSIESDRSDGMNPTNLSVSNPTDLTVSNPTDLTEHERYSENDIQVDDNQKNDKQQQPSIGEKQEKETSVAAASVAAALDDSIITFLQDTVGINSASTMKQLTQAILDYNYTLVDLSALWKEMERRQGNVKNVPGLFVTKVLSGDEPAREDVIVVEREIGHCSVSDAWEKFICGV